MFPPSETPPRSSPPPYPSNYMFLFPLYLWWYSCLKKSKEQTKQNKNENQNKQKRRKDKIKWFLPNTKGSTHILTHRDCDNQCKALSEQGSQHCKGKVDRWFPPLSSNIATDTPGKEKISFLYWNVIGCTNHFSEQAPCSWIIVPNKMSSMFECVCVCKGRLLLVSFWFVLV